MPLQNILSEGFVKEVFKSIQGEGKYAGALQLFVRFAGCSVKCKACDTDYKIEEEFDFLETRLSNPIKAKTLADLIYQFVKLMRYILLRSQGESLLIRSIFCLNFLKG